MNIRGAKWFLKGVNSPSIGFNWHPFEGAGIVIYYHIWLYITIQLAYNPHHKWPTVCKH